MQHTHTSLKIHVVFSTKNRLQLIETTFEKRLFSYIGGIIRELGGALLRANGVEDHVHLLMYLPPTIAVSEAVGKIKGSSSKWISQSFPHRSRFTWQRGFGAFTVSESQTSRVVAYIDGQKSHHAKVGFAEEYAAILRAHGIGIDTGG